MGRIKTWWKETFPYWEQDVHILQTLEINDVAHSDPDPSWSITAEFKERGGCDNPDKYNWHVFHYPIQVWDNSITVDEDSRIFLKSTMKWYRVVTLVYTVKFYRNGVFYREESRRDWR